MRKHPIETVEWWKAAGIRALKTFAQTMAAVIGTGYAAWGEVPWMLVISTALVAAVLSILTSIAGLPEVGEETDSDDVYQPKHAASVDTYVPTETDSEQLSRLSADQSRLRDA